MEISVIGSEDFVLTFAYAGIKGDFILQDTHPKQLLLKHLKNPEIKLLLIENKYADLLKADLEKHQLSLKLPIVIPLPGITESNRESLLLELITKSVGMSI